MGTWSLGSCADAVQNLVPNIPTALSGTRLVDVAERVRLRIEDWTGETVGSAAIIEKYQPALFNLTIAEVLPLLHIQGGDFSIGDMRSGRSALDAAQYYKEQGEKELKRLGMKTIYYKAFG